MLIVAGTEPVLPPSWAWSYGAWLLGPWHGIGAVSPVVRGAPGGSRVLGRGQEGRQHWAAVAAGGCEWPGGLEMQRPGC